VLAAGPDQAEQAMTVALGRAEVMELGVVELRDKAMTVVLVLLALAVSQLSVRAAQVVQEPLA
tara:strand:- start:347 stop:535 length:189 start_codon:yes stop_codon:yes gene_type:complete